MVVRNLNGVGVVASRARAIKDGREFDSYFDAPEFTNPILSTNAENVDTLEKHLPSVIRKYQKDTARLALVLKGDTLEQTLQNIWSFCYNYIQYKLDAPHEEQIRSPRRTWADRHSGVDCDCYTVFISTLLCNLGVEHSLRMSAYSKNRGYQHVYVVVPKAATSSLDKKGDYFTVDPVLEMFDAEKPYLFKKDKQMGTNALAGFAVRNLNGIGAVRSDLVWSDAVYSPTYGTWALKGLDGAYYIRGNKSLRFVEPVDGLGSFFKKIGRFAGKIVKPIASTALNMVAPGAGTLLSALTSGGGGGGGESTTPVTSAINNALPQGSFVQQAFNAAYPGASTGVSPAPAITQKVDTSGIESKIKASNSASIASINTTKTAISKDIKASNKAVVTSLDAVSKQFVAKMDDITSKLNAQLAKVQDQSEKLEEMTSQIALTSSKTATATAATAAGNEAILNQLSEVQDDSKQQNDKHKKYIIYIVITAVVAIVLALFFKNKSKSN